MPEGFRMPVLVTLRALPVNESEVPSRLIVGVPGMPVPLDPEAVRPLIYKFTNIKLMKEFTKNSIMNGFPIVDR